MGKRKLKRKPGKQGLELSDFDRLEIAELDQVERIDLFTWAIEEHARKGLISPEQAKSLMNEISKMVSESMEN